VVAAVGERKRQLRGESPKSAAVRSLLQGPGSLAMAGALINVGNLIVNVSLGRLLNDRHYGEAVFLVNVFMVLSIPGTALQIAVVRRVGAGVRAAGDKRPDVTRLLRAGWLITLVVALIGLAITAPVSDAMNLSSPIGLELVLLAAGCWLSLSVNRALLQVSGAYSSVARSLVFEGGLRVVAAIIGAVAGLGGASLALGLLVSIVASDVLARRGAKALLVPAKQVYAVASGVVREAWTAFAALAPLAVLQNLDLIVVGHFAPQHLGAYAAISTAAKVPVFLGVAVGNYLLAEAAKTHAHDRSLKPLLLSGLCVVVPAGCLLLIALVAPKTALSIVFGDRLSTAASALAPLTLAMTCFALAMLASFYLLGIGRRVVVLVLVAAAVITPVVVALAGGRPLETAWAMLATQGTLLATVGAVVAMSHFQSAARHRR
jgi:hypothetical protein